MTETSTAFTAPASSPVVPIRLGLDDRLRFRCRKGIACFNRCCEDTDILLTPYDIVRLKQRLGLSSREFIDAYTRDCELDGHGMPGLKLASKPASRACIHLTPEGCGVYVDRPTACRYYALGLLSLRPKGSPADEDAYFVVRESHCLGHAEPVEQTIREYRRSQGLDEYEEIDREWRRIVLKKRSGGPTVGRPSERSLQLFFLASYDVDGFRAFVASDGFRRTCDLPPDLLREVMTDDVAMLKFSFRFLRQVLFGEHSIPLRPGAAQERLARRRTTASAGAAKGSGRADDQDRTQDNLE